MKRRSTADRIQPQAVVLLLLGLLLNTVPSANASPAGSIAITGCPLDKAILAANQGSTNGTGCTFAGSGHPYIFTLIGNVSLSADLPVITSDMIIKANGFGYTIDQTALTAQYVLRVGGTGSLVVHAIRLTNTGGDSDGVVVEAGGAFTMLNSAIDSIGAFGIISLGTVVVKNSTISNSGLGIWIYNGSAVLSNSTVSGNLADGIFVDEGTSLTISDSTLVKNGGSGLDVDGNIVIDSTILAQNASFGCLVRIGQITSNGYNIESPGNSCGLNGTGDRMSVPATGTGGLNLDPNLAQNGPLSRPYTHALLAGSVAIDTISTTSGVCPSGGGSMDERGNVRAGQATSGDHRGGLACDVGAYEYDSTATLSAVTLKNLQGNSASAWPAPSLIGLAIVIAGGAWSVLRRTMQSACQIL